MVSKEWSVVRYGAVIAALFLIACIGYLVAVDALGIETEVMRDRFWKNAEPIFNGEIPITEYPPLALVFIAIPRLFADTPFGYNIAYVAQIFVFMVAGLYLTSRLAKDMCFDRKRAMLAYSVLMLLMLEFVLDRFDIIPAIFVLAAICLFVERHYEWTFLLLAIGALVKLYPAFLFPVFLVFLLCNGQRRDALRGTACFIVAGAVVSAAAWLVDPELITGFLGYHEGRPLQIESVAASLIYLLSMMGLTDVWIQAAGAVGSFGSDNLMGPLPDAVAVFLMPLMISVMLMVYVLLAAVGRRSGGCTIRMLGLASVAILMAFMVVNKVFSSQYLIWVISPLIFVVMSGGYDRGGRRLILAIVTVIVLTQVNFAYNIGYLGGGPNINDLGMMVLLLRNIVAVYLMYLSVRELISGLLPERHGGFRRCAVSVPSDK